MIAAAFAQADVVCTNKTSFGDKVTITFEGTQQKVFTQGGSARLDVVDSSGAIVVARIFLNVAHEWDGHMTGLATAPGMAFKYENHYGCLRNAVLTTDIRNGSGQGHSGYIEAISFKGCLGGSTPDEFCFP